MSESKNYDGYEIKAISFGSNTIYLHLTNGDDKTVMVSSMEFRKYHPKKLLKFYQSYILKKRYD